MTGIPDVQKFNFNLNPNFTSIILSNKKISYGELFSNVNKSLNFLIKKDIKENDIVALIFNNSFEFISLVLSLWEIGAIPVPLNSKLHEIELNEQVTFLKPKLVIKSNQFQTLRLSEQTITIPFDDLKDNTLNLQNFVPDKTALILFTSGSSGKPKAVQLSFNNLFQSALTSNKVLTQTEKDKWLASLPFYHIGGFSIIVRAITSGSSIIIPDSLSTKDLVNSIEKDKPTLASLVSNQLQNFVDQNFIPNKEMRNVLLGGGFSNNEMILNAVEKGWKIAKVYGSTETSSFVCFMNTEEVKKNPSASGKAIYPNKIIIEEDGEILVQSSAVMKGYYNNEEETSSKLKNGFYYTGDIGRLDHEGYLFVEARRNDLIVTGGENVNPFEIEKTILTHKSVSEVCVIGLEDKKWGQVVLAAVILKGNEKLTENELKDFLKEKIAIFKIPKQIKFIKQLPKSEIGKTLKEEVRKLFKQ